MNPYSSFHTHTSFCDGKNTPEEMVLEALKLGCPEIGFTGHSNTPFDPGYCMDQSREEAYIREVRRLQQVYGSRIRIHLGIEQDYYSAPADKAYEYAIGSVHYVKTGDRYLSVDDTEQILTEGVRECYGGDMYSLCEDYFALEADVIRRTGCRIVGHFDLITKFNEGGRLFDENHPRYRKAASDALQELLSQNALLEINTGAMARGYRSQPYPAPFLLEQLGKAGASVILTTDAHRKEDLLRNLSLAEMLAQRYGIPVRRSPFED